MLRNLAWLLFILILITALFWFLPRYDDFGTQDQLFAYFSTDLLVHHGPSHIPFGALTRPGSLLNVPVLALGGSLYGMGVLYVLVALGAGPVFFIGWFGAKLNSGAQALFFYSWFFPVSLSLGLLAGAINFTWILDYYTVPIIFMLYALGFYAWSARMNALKTSYGLAILSGFFFSISAMGNLAMMPGLFLMGILLAGLYWHKKTWVYLLSFVLSLSFFLWAYLIHWGLFQRFLDGVLTQWEPGASAHSLVSIQLMFLAGYLFLALLVLVFLMIFRAVISFAEAKKRYFIFRFLFLLSFFGLVLGNFSFVLICINPWLLFIWMLSCSLGFFFSIFYLINKNFFVEKKLRRDLALILIFLGLIILNRVISRGSYIFSLYEPLLLLWFVGFSDQEDFFKNNFFLKNIIFAGVVLIILSSAKNLIVPSYFSGTLWDKPYWISQNNTYSKAWTVKIPKKDAQVFEKYLKLYQQNHCDQKGFLAFDALVPMYSMVHRIPPYDQAWMDEGLLYPVDRYGTGDYLLKYLKNRKTGWCVIYREGSGFAPLEKNLGRDQVFNYLIDNKKDLYFLGSFSVGPDPKVFMFVGPKN